jgi:hypothetical protein
MHQQAFLNYIQSPQQLNNSNIAELEALVQQFPYFQSAYVLLSIAAKKHDAAVFQQHFKRTAISTTNRKQLYHLLHLPVEKENVAKTLIPEIKQEEVLVTEKNIESNQETSVETPAEPSPTTIIINENEERLRVIEERLAQIERKRLEAIAQAELEKAQQLKEQKAAETTLNLQQLSNVEQQLKNNSEFVLENEIEKSVVNSFVEKEILKTHTAKVKEEPFEEGSFNQWLNFFSTIKQTPVSNSTTNVSAKENTSIAPNTHKKSLEKNDERAQKMALIDKIIEKNPSHIRLDNSKTKLFTAEKNAKDSLLESEHLVTETLAKIYALQGNISKAIRAYEILSLKYPNKSVYFASLIKDLKKN